MKNIWRKFTDNKRRGSDRALSSFLKYGYAPFSVLHGGVENTVGIRRVERLMRDMLHEMQEQPFDHAAMVALKMNEFPILIQRYCHPHHTPKNFEYIVHFLQENYHEKRRLFDYAAQLHVSYDYFRHKFKELTGLSPQQFLMEQRLCAAEKLLRETSLSCTEIAFRCGFSTSAQFSALFKNKHGIPPLRFRHQKR